MTSPAQTVNGWHFGIDKEDLIKSLIQLQSAIQRGDVVVKSVEAGVRATDGEWQTKRVEIIFTEKQK